MEVIGVRELRQNASRYLEQVEAGETIEITNHGRAVARLVPVGQRRDSWEQLVAQGVVTPGQGSIFDVPRIPANPGDRSSQEILDEMRGDS